MNIGRKAPDSLKLDSAPRAPIGAYSAEIKFYSKLYYVPLRKHLISLLYASISN